MKTRPICALTAGCMLMAQLLPAPIYIKYGDIKGESQAQGYEEWIEVQSFAHGIRQGDHGPELRDMTIKKRVDKASPQLMREMVKVIPRRVELVLTLPGDDGSEMVFYTIILEDTKVKSLTTTRTEDRDAPTEELILEYERIKVIHGPSGEAFEFPEEPTTDGIAETMVTK